ncbi:MAG: hypothetical protein IJE52_00545 [Bacteroidales bacterium]|nr:hypothetical protein [Bacteroidales bacterium]
MKGTLFILISILAFSSSLYSQEYKVKDVNQEFVLLYDTTTGKEIRRFKHKGVGHAELSKDGKRLLTVSFPVDLNGIVFTGNVFPYHNLKERKKAMKRHARFERQTLGKHRDFKTSIIIWDVNTGKKLGVKREGRTWIVNIKFDDDGKSVTYQDYMSIRKKPNKNNRWREKYRDYKKRYKQINESK